MSTETWQADNHRYLVASLQWLRLRLQRLATEEPRGAASDATPPNSPGSSADEERGLIQCSFASGPPATKERLLSSEPQWSSSDDDIQEAAAETEPPPALVLLAQLVGLSAFERDTLLLCAAVEFDRKR